MVLARRTTLLDRVKIILWSPDFPALDGATLSFLPRD